MTNSNVLQIRKIIFENFNEIDLRFSNDEIFEFLNKNDGFDKSQTIDDLVNDFNVLGFPTTLFFDKNHKLSKKWTGYLDEENLIDQLKKINN